MRGGVAEAPPGVAAAAAPSTRNVGLTAGVAALGPPAGWAVAGALVDGGRFVRVRFAATLFTAGGTLLEDGEVVTGVVVAVVVVVVAVAEAVDAAGVAAAAFALGVPFGLAAFDLEAVGGALHRSHALH